MSALVFNYHQTKSGIQIGDETEVEDVSNRPVVMRFHQAHCRFQCGIIHRRDVCGWMFGSFNVWGMGQGRSDGFGCLDGE